MLFVLVRFPARWQGIVFTLVAAKLNKVYVLSFTLAIWSVFTLLTGFTDRFWQVAVVRIGQAVFEAGCTPFAAGIIAAYYPPHLKGTAMSVYNIGIYVGQRFSVSHAAFVRHDFPWWFSQALHSLKVLRPA